MKKSLFFPFLVFITAAQVAVAQNNIFPTTPGNVGIGTTTNLTSRLTIKDGGLADMDSYILGVHADDDYPFLAGFFNDSYSPTTPVLEFFGWNNNNGPFIPGDFEMGTPANTNLHFYTNGYMNPRMTISGSGNIGIGSTVPDQKLVVDGNIKSTGLIIPTNALAGKVLTSDATGNATWQTASQGWGFDGSTVSTLKTFGTVDNYALPLITNNVERMRISADGNISIGTDNAQGYRLAVNGNALFTKIKVKEFNAWPDYVFHKKYTLMPLKELELYIRRNNHLPEVPSAEEVEKEGVDIGETQALLLKKIEELTLHLIEQSEKLEKQQAEIDLLKNNQKK